MDNILERTQLLPVNLTLICYKNLVSTTRVLQYDKFAGIKQIVREPTRCVKKS